MIHKEKLKVLAISNKLHNLVEKKDMFHPAKKRR